MFWSLVRPDKILLPITRSAAVTTSLEADELAVGMITCEMCKGQDSWSFTPDQRQASALPGRLAVLSAYCGQGGGSKKEGAPRPGAATPQLCNVSKIPLAQVVFATLRNHMKLQ